ncbi:MAG: glycerol kinase GlpK [Chlamydiae bacterium]|nr:glycerol kinase GlpK [Chlamydiota bacterium]
MANIKKFILALDQGTTSSRSILFDLEGNVIASAQKSFRQFFPNPGLVEQDPLEIWTSQYATMMEALAKARIRPDQILAIGITNQRETTIVWDKKTGIPIYPAIVWQDRRTTAMCERLIAQNKSEWIQKTTGLQIDPYFSATKISWILDNVPGVRERALKGELAFGTVDTWLIYQLTGKKVHATDPSNASRTMLFDLKKNAFSKELLDLFSIPKSMLPDIRPSASSFGTVCPQIFPHPVPITGVIGDQQAALFGQGCFFKGMGKITYGTGCFILMNLGHKVEYSKHKMLTTVAWQIGDAVTYALEGSVFIGGAAVQWIRDGLGIIKNFSEIEELASKVLSADGVLFIPALTGLGAPHWDPKAKGAIFGITRGTKAAHLALATLQGIAFLVYDVIDAMQKDAEIPIKTMRVDGGVSKSDLILQFQTDLLQIEIERPPYPEMTALGAAFMAGLGVGTYKSIKDIEGIYSAEKTFQPNRSLKLQDLKDRFHKAIDLIRALEKTDGS